jgi:hypothetical protein
MARSNLIRPFLFLIAAVGAGLLGACAKDATAPPKPPPMTPETELTYAPLQGDTSSFRVRFFWNGSDVDGEVVQFRFAVDQDTLLPPKDWPSTVSKDTTLLFLVDPVKEIKGHVIWVVSEDDAGNFDPTPAKRFFSAKTLPPRSIITRGPASFGSVIGPNFTFEWEGIDPDGGETGGPAPVDSFEYLLLQIGAVADTMNPPTHPPLLSPYDEIAYTKMINEATGACLLPPYDDWCWHGIRGLRKRFRSVTPGPYVFAIRAVDIAGATEKNLLHIRNFRQFSVTDRNPGPSLQINSSVLTRPLPPASGPEDIVRKEIQIFEGEVISFSWTASAEAYGGEIVGYTYALDDTVTAEWGSINILKNAVTYQPAQLPPGIHNLYVRALDDGGLVTNAKIPLRIVHPSFKDPPSASNPPAVLYVDDSGSPGANPLAGDTNYPSDDVEDDWWRNVIRTPLGQEFGVVIQDWDTLRLNEGLAERGVPKPSDLAAYRVVIWAVDFNNSDSSPTGLFLTLLGGNYSELAGYLRAGGTLILTGFQLANNTGDRGAYTGFTQGMCATLDEGTNLFIRSYFPRNFMGLDGRIASDEGLRSLGARDFVEARVTPDGLDAGYQTAQVDVGDPGSGAKWNWDAFPGDDDQSLAPGLPKIEGWKLQTNMFACNSELGVFRREDPTRPIAKALFTYHGVPTGILMNGSPSPREGLICGISTQAHDLGNGDGSIILPGNPTNARGAIGRMVFFGFPIYYMKDPQAYALMRTAFAYVNASPTLPTYGP